MRMEPYLDSLNAEKRELEDRIYELEDEKERLAKDLEKCRRKNGDAPPEAEPVEAPTIEENGPPSEMLELPKIETGALDKSFSRKSDPPARVRPVSIVASSPPTHLYINPRKTGGEDRDQRPGDDGIVLLLEPRDASGRFVPQPGRGVSIRLLAIESDGSARGVARWELDDVDARRALRQESLDRGLLFRLGWPSGGSSPSGKRFRLAVRYLTADNRPLEAKHEITLKILKPSSKPRRLWSSNAPPAPPAALLESPPIQPPQWSPRR